MSDLRDPTHALWVDLETTGSDDETGHVLEIGALIVPLSGSEPEAELSMVVNPVEWDGYLDDAVREMHERNGLLAEVAAAEPSTRAGTDLALQRWRRTEVDRISREVGPISSRFVLAGSGVAHFDGRWLRRHYPLFAGALTYYSLDVGVLRRSFLWSGRRDLVVAAPEGGKVHRSIDDIRSHLAEWVRYRELLGSVPR